MGSFFRDFWIVILSGQFRFQPGLRIFEAGQIHHPLGFPRNIRYPLPDVCVLEGDFQGAHRETQKALERGRLGGIESTAYLEPIISSLELLDHPFGMRIVGADYPRAYMLKKSVWLLHPNW